MIIDAHCHVWRRWPYSPDVPDPEGRGSADALLYEMDQAGVDKAAVVCARIGGSDPRTANPDNNEFVAASAVAHPDRLVAIVDVDSRWSADYHRPGAAGRIDVAVEDTGAVGVAHYLGDSDDGWLGTDEGLAFFSRIAELGLFASVHAPPCWLPSLARLVQAVPDLRVLIHHQGLVAPHSRTFDADLRALTGLAVAPNVHVKVSGFHYLAERPWDYPYRGTHTVLQTLVRTFGPGRLAWGSDYPVARPHLTYRQSLEVVRAHAGLPGDAVRVILGGTMSRLLAECSGAR